MFIDQISVFMENKKGRLSSLTRILADNGIDLVALSIADTADYGIMRAIVNDTPGGLSDVLEIFSRGDVSVEYLYSFVRHQGKNALIMFKVTPVEKAVELLEKAGIELVTQEQVKKL